MHLIVWPIRKISSVLHRREVLRKKLFIRSFLQSNPPDQAVQTPHQNLRTSGAGVPLKGDGGPTGSGYLTEWPNRRVLVCLRTHSRRARREANAPSSRPNVEERSVRSRSPAGRQSASPPARQPALPREAQARGGPASRTQLYVLVRPIRVVILLKHESWVKKCGDFPCVWEDLASQR